MDYKDRLKEKKKIIVVDSHDIVPIYIWQENEGEYYVAQPKRSRCKVDKIKPEKVRELVITDDFTYGEKKGIKDYFRISKVGFLQLIEALEKLFLIEEL